MWQSLLRCGYEIIQIEREKFLDPLTRVIVDRLKKDHPECVKWPLDKIFDHFHHYVPKESLNDTRLDLLGFINNDYKACESIMSGIGNVIESLVGPEYAIQKKINLSIVPPHDKSSVLPLHSDVAAGNSAYELVIWIPLNACKKENSLFYFDLENSTKISKSFLSSWDQEQIYKQYQDQANFLELDPGDAFVFSTALYHGSRVNETNTTRWSLNFRVKSLFSPYNQKLMGDFFRVSPHLSPATRLAMQVKEKEMYD